MASTQETIIIENPVADACVNAGMDCYEEKAYPEAQAEFEKALAQHNEQPCFEKSDLITIWINLGNALTAQHKFEKAEPAFQSALQLSLSCDPKDMDTLVEILQNLAVVTFALHEYAHAEEHIRHALTYQEYISDESIRKSWVTTLSEILYAQNKFEEAREWILSAIAEGDIPPETRSLYGVVLLALGQPEEALKEVKQAFSEQQTIDPHACPVTYLTRLARISAVLGEASEDAREYLEQARHWCIEHVQDTAEIDALQQELNLPPRSPRFKRS
jgi:tetratricopeptide (TPR) repeat protein